MTAKSNPVSGASVAISPQAPRTWAELISWGTRLQIAVVALLLFAAYRVPISDLIVYRWWNDPNWSHGWLVPLFSLYFLSARRSRFSRVSARPSWVGLVVLVGAFGVYFASMLLYRMGYPQALSIVPAILGITLLLGGWGVLRLAWFPICYLALAVPLPDRYYFRITFPLREVASKVASTLLALITGAYTEASGVVIDYVYKGNSGHLNVEEACSGMRLIMAFVALGLAMAYLGERPTWQRVIMVLACVPIAMVCNVIRVTTTGCMHIYDYTSLASGTAHELLGLAMLPIALGLFAALGYVLRNIIVEESEQA